MENRCCIHLPGNLECPYPPLFVVRWRRRTAVTTPYLREVCASHLLQAICDAIADSSSNYVEVSLHGLERT